MIAVEPFMCACGLTVVRTDSNGILTSCQPHRVTSEQNGMTSRPTYYSLTLKCCALLFRANPHAGLGLVILHHGIYLFFQLQLNNKLVRFIEVPHSSGAVWESSGHPGLSVLTSLLVSVDVNNDWTMLRHWSQLVPNMSTDIWGH